MSKTKVVKIY